MANDLNRVSLVARLTKDPELRSLPSGQSVCELRVAFNTSKKVGESWEDQGNFINVTVWGTQGENVARHLHTGSRVAIDARLEHRTWKDSQTGANREAHGLVASSVQYLDPKPDGATGGQAARPAATPAARPAPVAHDDIPF